MSAPKFTVKRRSDGLHPVHVVLRDGKTAVAEIYDRDLARIISSHGAVCEALAVLARMADAYDENALDDGARKRWGKNEEIENDRPHDEIVLYSGRGGRELLTLADCMAARAALAQARGEG